MAELFAKKPEALENTIRIAEQREPPSRAWGYTQLPYAGEVCERAAYLRYLTYKAGGRATNLTVLKNGNSGIREFGSSMN